MTMLFLFLNASASIFIFLFLMLSLRSLLSFSDWVLISVICEPFYNIIEFIAVYFVSF